MDLHQLAADHVSRFNRSVLAGDFSPLIESLAEDATMTFEGLPVGPYTGKAAIAEAYRRQPPDDQIDLLGVQPIDEASALLEYAWRSDQARKAGQMRLRWDPEGRLRALQIRLP